MSILVGVHFVIDGDRLNLYSLGGISLKKLDEILRMGREPVLAHGAAPHGSPGFHPSRRTPDAREQIKIRIELPCLSQRGKDGGAVMLNTELLQIGIGLGSVI